MKLLRGVVTYPFILIVLILLSVIFVFVTQKWIIRRRHYCIEHCRIMKHRRTSLCRKRWIDDRKPAKCWGRIVGCRWSRWSRASKMLPNKPKQVFRRSDSLLVTPLRVFLIWEYFTGNVCIRSHSASSLNLSNQLSGSSSPSSDIAVSSLGQLKGWYDFRK